MNAIQGVELCRVHGNESFMYCKTCKRIICTMCTKCRSHEVITTDKLLEAYGQKLNISKKEEYKIKLNNSLENIITEESNCAREVQNCKNIIKAKENAISHSVDGKEQDYILIDNAISYLNDIKKQAFTDVLRSGLQKAINLIDIGDDVQKEVEGYEDELANFKKMLETKEDELRDYGNKEELLESMINACEKKDNNKGTRISLAIALDCGLITPVVELQPNMNIQPQIPQEKKKSIEDIFNLGRFRDMELSEGPEHVKFSKPIPVERKLRTGENIFASISSNGILGIYAKNGIQRKIQFTNLYTDEQVDVGVDGSTNIGFYDDKVVILGYNEFLRESIVSEVFKNPNLDAFIDLGNEPLWHLSDTSRINATKKLIYCTLKTGIFIYDFITHRNDKLEVPRSIWSIPSSTGIDIGSECIFKKQGQDNQSFLLSGGKLTPLPWDNIKAHLCTIIPSSSNPKKPENSLRIYSDGKCCINDIHDFSLPKSIKFKKFHSIVRLHHDIFMMYNVINSNWVFVKIVVP